MSEPALPPVVTALISPRSVKSCANIEWSITQTNDRQTTGRSLSVSLKHWRDSKAQFDAVKRTHSPTRSASRPSFPPDPLPLAFDPRVRASTKFGGDRPQQKGEKERRKREGENHHFNFSICSGATPETTDRRRRGSRRRRCAHPAIRTSSFLFLMMEQKSFSFSKSQI